MLSLSFRTLISLIEAADSPYQQPTPFEVGMYMYGYCHALALALWKLTGLPLYAIVEGPKYEETVVHVMVGLNDGMYLDIGGSRSFSEIRKFAEEEGEDTRDWRVISVFPEWINHVVKEGGLPALTRKDKSDAMVVARRIVGTFDSQSKRTT